MKIKIKVKSIVNDLDIAASWQAIILLFPSLHTAIVIDLDILHWNILLALSNNTIAITIAIKYISIDRW